jgi:hypothetical protein
VTGPAKAAQDAAPTEDPIVTQAIDGGKHAALARAIENLSPEEAAFFLGKIERALRKRKIQITGYLTAMGAWLVGTVLALAYYGAHTGGGFVGWVFLVPFGAVGAILYGFGRWAERVSPTPARPAKP